MGGVACRLQIKGFERFIDYDAPQHDRGEAEPCERPLASMRGNNHILASMAREIDLQGFISHL